MLCAYTRPRYQMSVFRTIGPLLLFVYDVFVTTQRIQKPHNVIYLEDIQMFLLN